MTWGFLGRDAISIFAPFERNVLHSLLKKLPVAISDWRIHFGLNKSWYLSMLNSYLDIQVARIVFDLDCLIVHEIGVNSINVISVHSLMRWCELDPDECLFVAVLFGEIESISTWDFQMSYDNRTFAKWISSERLHKAILFHHL